MSFNSLAGMKEYKDCVTKKIANPVLIMWKGRLNGFVSREVQNSTPVLRMNGDTKIPPIANFPSDMQMLATETVLKQAEMITEEITLYCKKTIKHKTSKLA